MRALGLMVLAASLMTGCESPEATRERGGGPGGDVGNRPRDVKLHAGSDPFWRTPDLIPTPHPGLEPARQARQVSDR